ncbi:MAG TPA: outer membrane beta-barrel protein [Granulicella sp.]|nr:outer membrane beta-barrel protein [Granulicella sp.]
MLKKYALLLCLAASTVPALHGQADFTASKLIDIQVGGSVVGALSDYKPVPTYSNNYKFLGYGIYSTIDFLPHIGLMLNFNQVDARSPKTEYERTYEIGGRYFVRYGRLKPYVKAMYGRGVFNFPPPPNNPTGPAEANLAYNLFALGGGADFRLKPYLNLRAEYEWQKWAGDQPLLSNGITPQLFSIGAAYHFR